MLRDHTSGLIEVKDCAEGCVEVSEVVEAQRLLELGHTRANASSPAPEG